MENCIFCKIANKEFDSNIVYENDYVIVIFDKFPSSKNGHMLVITKKHIENVFEVDSKTISEVYKVVAKIAKTMKKNFGTSDLHVLQNNGYVSEVNHFHVHLMPRCEGDLINVKWNPEEISDEDIIKLKEKLGDING